MAKLLQFSESHPKPAFSEEKQSGDREKLLKNRPKSIPRFKGPRTLLRKCHYPLICIHLYCKDWRRFCAQGGSKSARMAKLWQFSQGHPKPAFSEKVQRADEGKFFKNRLKVAFV